MTVQIRFWWPGYSPEEALESFDPSLVRSAASNFLISRHAARAGYEVLLSGEGGDELFCGYAHLKNVPYPLDHAKGEISIGHYMLEELPGADDLGAIYDAAQSVVDNLATLSARLVGRLAVVGERVEKLLGLDPLPEPPEEDASKSPEQTPAE